MSIRNTVLALAVVPLAMSVVTPASAGFFNNPMGNLAKGKLAGPGFIGGGPGKGNLFGGVLKGPGTIPSGSAGKRNGPANIAIVPAKGPLETVLAGPAKAPGTVVGTVLNGAGNLAGGVGNVLKGAGNVASGGVLSAANTAANAPKDTGERKPAPTSADKGDKGGDGKGSGGSPPPFPSLANTFSYASDGSGPPTIAPVASAGTMAPATSASCLTKAYLQPGVVLFTDVCTKEWAMNSNSAASQVVSTETRACLTKEYPRAGMVLFKDTCTEEWAMTLPDRQARGQDAPAAQVR
jgi:hypothetical protein